MTLSIFALACELSPLLMWVNFGLGWLKCGTFSIIQVLMQVQPCKFTLALLILHLSFYYLFTYPEDKGKELTVIVVSKKRETIIKNLRF